MFWADIAPTLTKVVKSIALETADPLWLGQDGVDDVQFWADGQTPFISPGVQAEIKLRIPASRDILTERRTHVDQAGQLYETLHGMREFTLNVLAKSYSQEFADWAHEYAERVRTRIQRRTVQNQLLAVQVVLVEAGPINDIRLIEDGRATSVASLDLRMRAGFADVSEALGWIERVELTSKIKNTAGVEYPAPPNLDAVVASV